MNPDGTWSYFTTGSQMNSMCGEGTYLWEYTIIMKQFIPCHSYFFHWQAYMYKESAATKRVDNQKERCWSFISPLLELQRLYLTRERVKTPLKHGSRQGGWVLSVCMYQVLSRNATCFTAALSFFFTKEAANLSDLHSYSKVLQSSVGYLCCS